MVGNLIGDIVGSAYEFSHFKSKNFAPLFHAKARFTDDTVCTIAVADALIRGTDPQVTLIDWCKRYAENGGWGKKFALWFLDFKPKPYGSWGNGAAMRIAPVGLLANTEADVIGWSDTMSVITHNHPDAMKSAQAVALAIFWARQKSSAHDIGQLLTDRYGHNLSLTPDDIRPTYKRTKKRLSIRYRKPSVAPCTQPVLKTPSATLCLWVVTATPSRRLLGALQRRCTASPITSRCRPGPSCPKTCKP